MSFLLIGAGFLKQKINNIIYIVLGFIALLIGLIGIILPILPTTPLLLLALYFFTKGSEKVKDWFVATKIYNKYLDGFIRSRSMTLKSKLKILLPVSALLIITAFFFSNFYIRLLLGIVFIGKYYYFFTFIETTVDVSDLKAL